jgi:phosphatidylserine/phosphatidylglycerophosphate/cardiolipin synthase-like enzyme
MGADEALAALVAYETPERVEALAAGLESGTIRLEASPARLRYLLPAGPRIVERTSELLTGWGGDETTLGAALRGALAVRLETEDRGARCELAWTGPTSEVPVRTTNQLVDEMLGRCARDVLLVQYAVTTSGRSNDVFARLGELAREGVRVTWIVDKGWVQGRSVRSIRQGWPERTPRPRVYSYTVEEDELAKLHAKVLIVDDRDLFVTSANLTGYGYAVNLEFGVRVQGTPAVRASEHFAALIRSGLVEAVEW